MPFLSAYVQGGASLDLASRAYEGSWGIHCEVEDSANSVVFDRFFVENRVNSLRRPFWIERVEQ